jgi:beta-lactamase class A
MIDRRTLLAAAAAAALAAACSRNADAGQEAKASPEPAPAPPPPPDETAAEAFEAIRSTLGPGGRFGIAAIDTGSGRRLVHDSDSRYPLASTFKLPLAAAVLAEVEKGRIGYDEELPFAPGDPLGNSPTVEANLALGKLPVRQLCGAVIERSDNSAANMLLKRLGGPEAFNAFVRRCGDEVTRLDRYEMEMGSNAAGDVRDTTSPAAMAGLVRTLLLGDVLEERSRNLLRQWMIRSVPGPDRLRAGLPEDWLFGHKTGTAANGGLNDVGIAWRSGAAPIVIACYLTGGEASAKVRAAAHASAARIVAERLG